MKKIVYGLTCVIIFVSIYFLFFYRTPYNITKDVFGIKIPPSAKIEEFTDGWSITGDMGCYITIDLSDLDAYSNIEQQCLKKPFITITKQPVSIIGVNDNQIFGGQVKNGLSIGGVENCDGNFILDRDNKKAYVFYH